MFNAEKLLGGLIGSTTRGRGSGLGGLVTSGVAMGALGVAMEAVEHFMNKPKGGPPPGPASAPGSPPPPPPMAGNSSASPPPPPSAAAESGSGSDAVLLIRSMIAAANADGVIDQAERDNILKRLETVGLSTEEHAYIVQELLSPADLDTIVEGVHTPELARQVYAVSLMAIEVDTDIERAYMENLARRLSLDAAVIQQIHSGVGLKSE